MVLLALLALRTFLLQPKDVAEDAVRRRPFLALLIGLLAGMVGGATGTGGGAVLVPLALYAGMIANERVVGLSNMVMVATSLAGSIAHFAAQPVFDAPWTVGHVYLALVPLVFIGAQLGSPCGKWINSWLTLPRPPCGIRTIALRHHRAAPVPFVVSGMMVAFPDGTNPKAWRYTPDPRVFPKEYRHMKTRWCHAYLLLAVVACATGIAHADTVCLKNGDRVSGTVHEAQDGVAPRGHQLRRNHRDSTGRR